MANSSIESLVNMILSPSFGILPNSSRKLPKPTSIVYQKQRIKLVDKDGNPLRDENNKRIVKEGNYITIVMFDDGIQVEVKQGDNDKFDLEKALLYAIAKRAYGKLETFWDEKSGHERTIVDSNGYNCMIHKLVNKAIDKDALNAAREAKKTSKPKTAAASEKKIEPIAEAKPAKKTSKKPATKKSITKKTVSK